MLTCVWNNKQPTSLKMFLSFDFHMLTEEDRFTINNETRKKF